MPKVAGKVALITGAARGMGRAAAVLLAEEGADVIAFDLCGPIEGRGIPASTAEDLHETVRLVEKYGRQAIAVVGDTRSSADLRRAVDEGLASFGRLDIVVASAGTAGGMALAQDISDQDWQTTIDIVLTGVWRTVKAALPVMIAAGNGGSVVLISSTAAIRPMRHLADYGAAKAGIIHLGKILALENGEHGIRVNVLAPGTTDTPLVMNPWSFAKLRPDLAEPTRADVEDAFARMKPMKGKPFLDARDIANAVLWLASDDASTVSGTVLPVDMAEAIGDS